MPETSMHHCSPVSRSVTTKSGMRNLSRSPSLIRALTSRGNRRTSNLNSCRIISSKHPKRKREVQPKPTDGTTGVIVELKELQKVIKRSVANGSQPGPSGMTGEMLRVFIEDDDCKKG